MSCPHEDTWFDRSICPDPCGMMHTVCNDCVQVLDYCPWRAEPAREDLRERSWDKFVAAHFGGDETLAARWVRSVAE